MARKPEYQEFHQRRFDYLWRLTRRFEPSADRRVLDVGVGPFTHSLCGHYRDVFALTYRNESGLFVDSELPEDKLIVFDLNLAYSRDRWIRMPQFDLIVFAEVIEHLFVPPEVSLGFLASALVDGGKLICQTPNATSLEKRIRMVTGHQPYDRKSAGHYREFKKEELVEAGARCGLKPVFHEFADYFGVRGSILKRGLGKLLHGVGTVAPTLRRGQTIVFSKEVP